LLRTLTIKGRWAVWVLMVFALATALTVLDTVVWWRDGPRYTHAMWFADRMDRIREDDKLRARIEALERREPDNIAPHTWPAPLSAAPHPE
jgi:hypothetical protein